MPDDLVLDTAAELEPIESTETETELEPADSGAEAEPGTEAAEPGADAGEQSASAVWREVKERLKDQPALHKQVKNALHTMEDLKKRLPDGIGKTVERLEALNQLDDDPEDPEYVPGSRTMEEVISNTIAERTFWRDFDSAFQAGDNRVINQMIEANPASFEKLAPAAMDKWAETNPADFSTYVCRSMNGFLESAEIPLQMALLARVLPESSNDPGLQTVIDAFKSIKGVFEQVRASAKRELAPKAGTTAPTSTAPPQQGATTEQREMNLRHNEWIGAISQRSNTLAANEAAKLAGKTKFTSAEVSTIQKAIREEVGVRTKANDAYQNRLKGYLKANNKAGFVATVESEHRKIIPGAVKRAVQDAMDKRKAAGAQPRPAAQPQARPNGAAPAQADERFEMIAGPPRTQGLKVDFARTPHSMLAKDQAYVVGRKNPVKWRRK